MATITRGRLIRADLANWDGRNATATRPDASGGTVTGLAVGNEVDILQVYGSGTDRTVATINSAKNYISSANVTIVFASGTWTIDSNVTIPSNIICHIPAGCVFDVSTSVTLTLSGPVFIDSQTWTSGAGTVNPTNAAGNAYKTSAEVTASVTPTNYAYPPGHLYRYGTNTTPGTTDMSTAFANAALVAATHPMMLPGGRLRVNTGFVLPADGSIIGDHWQESIIEWYGSGACIRVVGTVNVGGANYARFEEFKIRTQANDNYGIAALWGGTNVFRRVRFSWDSASSNRFRHCCIIDQTTHTLFEMCAFQGWMDAAILGPYTGEFTDYGTSTSSYNTVVKVDDACEFNSQYDANTTAIALDRGELAYIGNSNFNATPIAIRISRAYTALKIDHNYFERLEADYHATNNRGPALLVASTSYVSGASITATATGSIQFINNHVEWRQRGAPDNDGIVEFDGGYDGTAVVDGNEFQQGFSHCVLIRSGTVKTLKFGRGNSRLTADEAIADDGFKKSVYIESGAITQLEDQTAIRVALPATVKEFGWDGQKILFASAVPSGSGGSALEGQTVATGDVIVLEDGSGAIAVTAPGSFGSAGVVTGSITSGTALLTVSAAGNLDADCRITIAGVTGVKTIKQRYNDGSVRIVLDSNADATVAGAAVAFQTPTMGHIFRGINTQTTVGAAGGASALPATPTGYVLVNISGTVRAMPFYATS